MLGHPAGVLAWQHRATCGLLVHEDATANADFDRLDARGRFVRDATETERELLAASGYVWTIEPLATLVSDITPAVRVRVWPALTREATP